MFGGFFVSYVFLTVGLAPSAENELWVFDRPWNRKGHCAGNSVYLLTHFVSAGRSMEEVDLAITPNDRGNTLDDISNAVSKFGIRGNWCRVALSELRSVESPSIIHIAAPRVDSSNDEPGHFLVVLGFDSNKNKFAVIDPLSADGYFADEASLSRGYSGIAFVVEQEGSFIPAAILAVNIICICALAFRLNIRR